MPKSADLLPDSPTLPASAKQRAAQARCEAMVNHARALILVEGVGRLSVNEVLRLSGGSKATLVKYFGDRDGLISAAIRAEAQTAIAALDLDSEETKAMPLGSALSHALSGVLRFYLTPGALALYRAVVSSAATGASGGAEAFYAHGHGQIMQAIAALLTARQPTEVRGDINCAEVADHLLHAIRACDFEKTLIGLSQPPADHEISHRITATVNLILPGISTSP